MPVSYLAAISRTLTFTLLICALSFSSQAILLGAEWEEFGQLSQPRTALAAVYMDDGRVLVMGGFDENRVAVNTVEILDLEAGTVRVARSMAEARAEFIALQGADGFVYAVSGATNSDLGNTPSVERFDPASEQWTTIGNLELERRQFHAVFINDTEILVVGGDAGDLIARAHAEIFDVSTGTTRRVSDYPTRINEHFVGLLSSGQNFVAGGRIGGEDSDRPRQVYSYVRAGDAWLQVGELENSGPGLAGMRLRGGSPILSGGTVRESNIELIEDIHAEINGNFQKISTLQVPRFLHSMAQWSRDSVLIAGGFNGENEPVSSVEWLNVGRRVSTPGDPMDVERAQFALVDAAEFTPRGDLRLKRILAIGGTDADREPTDLIEIMQELAPEIPVQPRSINFYAAVTNIEECPDRLTVNSRDGFQRGDRIMIIQMQGGTFVDQAGNPSYGQVNSTVAGQWEFVTISSIQGSQIFLENTLENSYDLSGKIQIVSVPEYDELNVLDPIIARPWNGSIGGVIALSANSVQLFEDIDASFTGMRGGTAPAGEVTVANVNTPGAAPGPNHAGRGEGFGGFGAPGLEAGRNYYANAGGGGNAYKAGGAGGANISNRNASAAADGGQGGFGEINGQALGRPQEAAGLGGLALSLPPETLLAGGGGGAGHADGGVKSNGARGGGIVMIESDQIRARGGAIRADGAAAAAAIDNGGGGGGAGGAIALFVEDFIGDLVVTARGGDGANVNINGFTQRRVGPGGGGGGGSVVLPLSSTPDELMVDLSGGNNGLFTNQFAHGATPGANGTVTLNADQLEGSTPNTALSLTINTVEREICLGDSIIFRAGVSGAGAGLEYIWSPISAFSSIEGPVATLNANTVGDIELSVTVRDVTECEQSAAMYVVIEDCKRCDEISGIVNDYYPVESINIESRRLTIPGNPMPARGDKFLLIQMQGAAIDASNTENYGQLINSQGAGDYEFVEVRSSSYNEDANTTELLLRDDLTRTRYNTDAALQLLSTPEYNHVTVSGELRAEPWNGRTGGVIAVLADCIMLEADVQASGIGFRGGAFIKQVDCNLTPNNTIYASDELCTTAPKGEGIAGFGLDGEIYGRGAPANGGGAGNNHNAGGAGGANYGFGGDGGYGVPDRPNNRMAGGVPAYALSPQYGVNAGKAFMGGGGGAGHINHGNGSGGATGGGIVIFRSGSIRTDGERSIWADGLSALDDTAVLNPDGCGGGGAGGTIVIDAAVFEGALTVYARGGNGGSQLGGSSQFAGPGGGGGGGVFIGGAQLDASAINTFLEGGAEGTIPPREEFPGATAGGNGAALTMSSIASGTDLGDYENCRGCRPIVQNIDFECGEHAIDFFDQSIQIVQITLQSNVNTQLQIVDATPANAVRVLVSSIDPDMPGEYVIIAQNQAGRTVEISGTIDIAPTATIVQPDVNDLNLMRVDPEADAYQWYRDGFRLTGTQARSREFRAEFGGEYYADIFYENGCESRSNTITIVTATSVNEQQAQNFTVRAYPNPVQENLIVDLQVLDGKAAIVLRVADLLGREWLSQTLPAGTAAASSIKLNLADLPAGTYTLTVSNDAETQVLPLIKQ